MPKFEIYAGLGGGFGGADYQTTEEFDTEDQAMAYALECACEVYESYAGLHGLLDWDGVKEDLIESGQYTEDELTEDIMRDAYSDSRESWLSYYVKEINNDEVDVK